MGFKIEVILDEDVSEEEANNFQDDIEELALEKGLGIVTVAVLPDDEDDEPSDEEIHRLLQGELGELNGVLPEQEELDDI